MKFLAIRLQNLNSLRGNVTIEFDKEPFVHTGLFAITGDTGAGKTTILDAITLALFSQTSREHEKEVMSNGTSECFAEVVFLNEKGRFLVRWQQKRSNRKADPLPVTRDMARWDADTDAWRIIASGKTEVDGGKGNRGAVEQYLGLDYDQFKRTILLAQGEFAAFLLSDERNRSAVLERLTDTEIYTRISKAAFDRAKETRIELDQLKIERNARQLLSPDAVQELETNLLELNESVQYLQVQQSALHKQEALLRQIHAIQEAMTVQARETEELENARILFAPDAFKLQQHQNLLPLAPLTRQWREIEQESAALEESVGNAAPLMRTQEQQLANLLPVLDARQTTITNLEQEIKILEPLARQAMQLEEQIQFQAAAAAQDQRALNDRQQRLGDLLNQRTKQQDRHAELAQQFADTVQWLEQHPEGAVLERQLIQVQEQHLPLLREIHARLRTLEATLTDLQPARDQLTQRMQAVAAQYEDAVLQAHAAQEDWATLFATLPAKWRQAGPPEAIVAMVTAYLQSLEDFTRHFQDYREKLRHIAEMREQQEHLSTAAEITLKLLFEAEDEVEQARRNEDIKRLRLERERKALHLERDRASLLVAGEPCPLCGSLHHPFAEENTLVAIADDAQRDWDQARIVLDQAQARYTRLNIELRDLGQSIKKLELEFGDLLETQARDFLEQPDNQELLLDGLNRQLVLDEHETGIDVQESALQERIGFTRQLIGQVQHLAALLQTTTMRRMEQEHQKMLVEKESELLLARWTQMVAERDELQEKSRVAAHALNTLLAPYHIVFSPDAAFAEALAGLRLLHAQYQEYAIRRDRIQQEKTLLTAEMTATEANIDEKNAEVAQWASQLEQSTHVLGESQRQREQIVGNRNPLEEQALLQQRLETERAAWMAANAEAQDIREILTATRSRLEATTAQSAQLIQKQEALGNTILSKIHTLMPDNMPADDVEAVVASVLSNILPETEAQRLEQNRKQLEEQGLALDTRRKTLEADLANALQQPGADTPLPEVIQALRAIEAERTTLDQRVGAIQTELEANSRRAAEAEALLARIQAKEAALERQEQLRALIGSADGAAFRRYAQGLTLDQLVEHTNRHLSKLQGGRYRLRKRPEKDLELEITDTFQADFVRSVNTLSGGETFLVSLALALGLADMTNRKTRIQSLFIDEGFGALDENSLEMAIETLEGLQSQGVMIGVITHIREMMNRISTQVRIVKKADGFSAVEVV